MALIGYARCSTTDQNLDAQRDALKTAGCLDIHEDAGVSGGTTARSGLDAALQALRPGDTLVTDLAKRDICDQNRVTGKHRRKDPSLRSIRCHDVRDSASISNRKLAPTRPAFRRY
jgi:DNA invertase Pin-like site-specific DNA recombinase